MELKLGYTSSVMSNNNVLIVPLWNWNESTAREIELPNSFNRTFMELKYLEKMLKELVLRSFNRTFMELKYNITELISFRERKVLIVPLWNWNSLAQGQQGSWMMF